MSKIDEKIKEHLPEEELLLQLAEECSELAYAVEELRDTGEGRIKRETLDKLSKAANLLSKAALKQRRAITGINPTPKTYEEAREDLIEEAADVYCVLGLLLSAEDHLEIYKIIEAKKERWLDRLEGNSTVYGGWLEVTAEKLRGMEETDEAEGKIQRETEGEPGASASL